VGKETGFTIEALPLFSQKADIWGLRGNIPHANGAPHPSGFKEPDRQSGRSSGVEHNLAKVGVEGSNPFARSNVFNALGDIALAAQSGLAACVFLSAF
jgi:hypothetical protein